MNNVELVHILGPVIWLLAILVVITPSTPVQVFLILIQLIIFGTIIVIDLREEGELWRKVLYQCF